MTTHKFNRRIKDFKRSKKGFRKTNMGFNKSRKSKLEEKMRTAISVGFSVVATGLVFYNVILPSENISPSQDSYIINQDPYQNPVIERADTSHQNNYQNKSTYEMAK